MPPISWDHDLMLACCVQFDYLFQSPSKAPHGKWSTKLLTSTIKLNWRPCWFTPSSSQSHFTICNIFIPLLNSHFVEWLLVLLIFPLTESSEPEAVKWIWISSLAIFMLNWYCILFATPQFFFFVVFIRQSLKACAVLSPLLGFAWMFGVLAVTTAGLVFQYLFTILNSLQVKKLS